jgi:Immunity protein 27
MLPDTTALRPEEELLIGRWVELPSGVGPDETAKRIDVLIELFLVRVAIDASGWDGLYRDPADGRLWEVTYPESELNGGGPPKLECVSREYAADKYAKVST